VDKALEAGRAANIPVMVDFGFFLPERPYYELVTKRLRPGDISTHVYRSAVPWIDEQGKLYPYLAQARERGVKFDVGHGGGSFHFRNAVPAVAQGFWPDSISTDLHADSMNAGMQDLPTTMSKFLNMGVPLAEVIKRSTWMPAELIHHPERGHLSIGADADIAVLRVADGQFGFTDSSGGTMPGKQRIFAEMTLLAGEVVWDWNGRAGTPWQKLPPDYGMRPGADFLVRPPK
jgi:dihydroorotase